MKTVFYLALFCLACLSLAACDDETNFAPVAEVSSMEPLPKNGIHRVTHGETLYEIAWRYGLDYRDLAAINQMKSPYILYSGQQIYLHGNHAMHLVKTANKPTPIKHKKLAMNPIEIEPNYTNAKWVWPAKGKVINYYSALNKGIDISGQQGQSIYAAAGGKVVYCGDGLRGYGNLIILKHNSLYLSAYAHNRKVFVKEGDFVKQGQKIAEMGNTGSDKVILHFEIRRAGKPINPISVY